MDNDINCHLFFLLENKTGIQSMNLKKQPIKGDAKKPKNKQEFYFKNDFTHFVTL